jgi:hypothetical protein
MSCSTTKFPCRWCPDRNGRHSATKYDVIKNRHDLALGTSILPPIFYIAPALKSNLYDKYLGFLLKKTIIKIKYKTNALFSIPNWFKYDFLNIIIYIINVIQLAILCSQNLNFLNIS